MLGKRMTVGVLVLLLAATTWGMAADHKEAPLVQATPGADINDLYAFLNPNDSSRLVLVLTVNPFSVPGAATSFNFSPNLLYRFKIDNDGDAIEDHVLDVNFAADQTFEARFKLQDQDSIVVTGQATPPSIGETPTNPFVFEADGVQVFAGPRDDPFFFDGVGFGRFVSGIGGFSGDDTFAGFNVSAIVVEFPVDLVVGDSPALNLWGTTETRLLIKNGQSGFGSQLDRVGNPAVSTAVIPSSLRDEFNRTRPHRDAELYAGVIVASLQALGTNEANIGILASVAVPDVLTIDTSLPSGFPNGRGPADDVIDTILFFVFNQTPVSDGVNGNDADFSDTFPYLAPPFQP